MAVDPGRPPHADHPVTTSRGVAALIQHHRDHWRWRSPIEPARRDLDRDHHDKRYHHYDNSHDGDHGHESGATVPAEPVTGHRVLDCTARTAIGRRKRS